MFHDIHDTTDLAEASCARCPRPILPQDDAVEHYVSDTAVNLIHLECFERMAS